MYSRKLSGTECGEDTPGDTDRRANIPYPGRGGSGGGGKGDMAGGRVNRLRACGKGGGAGLLWVSTGMGNRETSSRHRGRRNAPEL